MILVTGSAGHLGEALIRTLREDGTPVTGLDAKPSPFTDHVGSITDRVFVRTVMKDVHAVIHTATLHKPHIGTHSRQEFIDTNVSGTLNLLEEAVTNHCRAFIYTSTTSVFGDAMRPTPGDPAVWVSEQLKPLPKNIYGVTKSAAEDLCRIFHRNTVMPCIVLRTSRFFPDPDDDEKKRDAFSASMTMPMRVVSLGGHPGTASRPPFQQSLPERIAAARLRSKQVSRVITTPRLKTASTLFPASEPAFH